MLNFKDKMIKSSNEHKSNIVLNLDVMPTYMKSLPEGYDYERFMIDIITELTPNLAAIKINSQHLFLDFGVDEVKKIVDLIHELGGVVILDHKLADIGNTNLVAVSKIFRLGFDAITVHPIIGFEEGLSVINNQAKKYNAGVISVSLMSHPGSKDFYYLKLLNDDVLFKRFIKKSFDWGLDGIVIGSTHISILEELAQYLKELSYEPIIISPGFGAQGGKLEPIHKVFKNYYPAVGRDIIYAFENEGAKNPLDAIIKRLEYYNNLFERI